MHVNQYLKDIYHLIKNSSMEQYKISYKTNLYKLKKPKKVNDLSISFFKSFLHIIHVIHTIYVRILLP